jgi:hypothetical protein
LRARERLGLGTERAIRSLELLRLVTEERRKR